MIHLIYPFSFFALIMQTLNETKRMENRAKRFGTPGAVAAAAAPTNQPPPPAGPPPTNAGKQGLGQRKLGNRLRAQQVNSLLLFIIIIVIELILIFESFH